MAQYAMYIPWLAAFGAVLCGVCCARKELAKLAGPICVLSVAGGFVLSVMAYTDSASRQGTVVELFKWISFNSLQANMAYYLDGLTMVMLFVVTGVGSLIALYATGYMKDDPGYPRFFFGVSLFIFAMTSLVMADNFVLLYLGWEGVGLCSYLLIGYYHDKPVAVAAAKKAFIVNRIGDLGFALGLFLTYMAFGSVEFDVILPAAQAIIPAVLGTGAAQVSGLTGQAMVAAEVALQNQGLLTAIPFLLMLGAFGKSAQIPLYVWLPDAMAGPTPVSALVHAATMVTSGVYMIARLTPIFELSPYALPAVAIIGAVTCLFAGTIALANNDLKGVFAYSTVSQLGYMFIGVAAISAGGVFHLMTHAFFKALLFLTAGSVMHALAGTLDIRHISGLRHKMPVTCWLMFAGCLALAGFPFTAGFYSKDIILGDAMVIGLDGGQFSGWFMTAAILGIITAFLTAFYTFRLWFMVFTGEERYSYGGDGHTSDNELERAMIEIAAEHEHHDDYGQGDHGHAREPHEAGWWPMNAPLALLAVLSIVAGVALYAANPWIKGMLYDSSQFMDKDSSKAYAMSVEPSMPADASIMLVDHHHADPERGSASEGAGIGHGTSSAAKHGAHPTLLGLDPHTAVEIISGTMAVIGILLAGYLYWLRPKLQQKLTEPIMPVIELLRHKYFVDELYDGLIVTPLRALAYLFFVFDQVVVSGLVMVTGQLPVVVGRALRPLQHGRLQGYALAMAAGLAIVMVLIFRAISV